MIEQEIANKNIYNWKAKTDGEDYLDNCIEHLASCKRFLDKRLKDIKIMDEKGILDDLYNKINKEIKDLQQAIKIYNEVGLKWGQKEINDFSIGNKEIDFKWKVDVTYIKRN